MRKKELVKAYGKFKIENHIVKKKKKNKHSFVEECDCMPVIVDYLNHVNVYHRAILNMEIVKDE